MWIFVILLFAVILGPVIYTQMFPPKPRQYQGVSLSQLSYQEISFQNKEQNIDLTGMLFIPKGDEPFPAVVIIHGSGTSQRDNLWHLTIVHHLQENGIIALVPDKRGSGSSQGNWRTSSFEDLATDTIAAVNYLKEQNNVMVSQIGVIGLSQGGWIAPIVATKSSDISFIIDVVGTSVTAHEQLLYEENNNLREMGFLPGISNAISYVSTFVLRNFSQKGFWNAIGNFDPLPYWQDVNIPTLVMYGNEDTNVPTMESKRRFELINQDNINVRIYEGSGHALEDPIEQGDSIFREEALIDITKFINSIETSP
jgi:dipeptidyl aminopeptidase/acylaminoacyl peptidase